MQFESRRVLWFFLLLNLLLRLSFVNFLSVMVAAVHVIFIDIRCYVILQKLIVLLQFRA